MSCARLGIIAWARLSNDWNYLNTLINSNCYVLYSSCVLTLSGHLSSHNLNEIFTSSYLIKFSPLRLDNWKLWTDFPLATSVVSMCLFWTMILQICPTLYGVLSLFCEWFTVFQLLIIVQVNYALWLLKLNLYHPLTPSFMLCISIQVILFSIYCGVCDSNRPE